MKKTIDFYQMNPKEVRSTCLILRDKTTDLCESNSFLATYYHPLAQEIAKLNAALSKVDLKELTKRSNSYDSSFGKSFSKLRRIVKMKSEMEELGDESASSAILYGDLERFGGEIEEFPKEAQINTMDEILVEWDTEVMQNHIAQAGVSVYYELAKKDHAELKTVEMEKGNLGTDLKDIPATWDARNSALPIVCKIFNHIEDFADVEERVYRPLLKNLIVELTPISVQAAARKTRRENSVSEA